MAHQIRAAPPASRSYPPNATLFCGNLPINLKKEDLRRSLFMLFTTYGHVLDVVNMRTAKLRGVAHVTFRDSSESTQAMRACQNFDFFGKPMRIAYAKSKSDIFAKIEGKFEIPTAQNSTETAGLTDIQKAVFGGAPGTKTAGAPGTTAPPASLPTLPPKPAAAEDKGAKRPREEESEPEDEGDAMEVSDSD